MPLQLLLTKFNSQKMWIYGDFEKQGRGILIGNPLQFLKKKL